MERRAQVWIGIGIVVVLFLIFNALQSTKYYDDLDAEQQRALQELAMNVTTGIEPGMNQLNALLYWQTRAVNFSVPDGYVSQEADHDPLAIIGRGWGLCFDRSYVFELLAESLGYEVRHVALASKDATHAVSEVKVGGSWVLFDTSYNRTYQNNKGKYLSVVDLHHNREYITEENLKPLYDQ
ncbi:transglutaminase domain-containing protein, partial [Candidatus Woesearchaeota archaeon]|nr:transglutaminase domain-containing protein [Candidatus Woesearchaeota archaeon]